MGGFTSTVQKIAGSGAAGVFGLALRKQKLKAEKKGRREAEARLEPALAEQRQQKAIADESVRAQAAKARRRTVFAGSDIERDIFRRTLGGGSGATTLGE